MLEMAREGAGRLGELFFAVERDRPLPLRDVLQEPARPIEQRIALEGAEKINRGACSVAGAAQGRRQVQ